MLQVFMATRIRVQVTMSACRPPKLQYACLPVEQLKSQVLVPGTIPKVQKQQIDFKYKP
jgi:hypothetical protein